MKIHDDHMYHGAALTQIAEHPQFTAINGFLVNGSLSRSSFRINNDVGVYLKYAAKPFGRYKEYRFTFTSDNLEELTALAKKTDRVFAALVCIKHREVCCLPYTELLKLREKRREEKGTSEDQYVVLVNLEKNQSFRVYINAPGVKGKLLGKPVIIPRNDFPNALFSSRSASVAVG